MNGLRNFVKIYLVVLLVSIISCGGGSSNKSDADITPPSDLKFVSVSVGYDHMDLNWTDPSDQDFDHAEITWLPSGSTVQSVAKGMQTLPVSGLSEKSEYTFTVKSVDKTGNVSTAVTFTITTNDSAVIGDSEYFFIYTANDLNAVRGGVTGYAGWGPDKNYIVMADIDLSAWGNWTPIANDDTGTTTDGNFHGTYTFTGVIDGNGHVIRNLTINQPSLNFTGLFGFTDDSAYIKNLGLVNVNISGRNFTGGLAGMNYGSTIYKCYTTGIITNSLNQCGGLVGYHTNHGSITECYSEASVSCAQTAGGLAGRIEVASVTRCYSTGSVSATESQSDAGGMFGSINTGTITDCYARGSVTGADNVGGFAGHLAAASSAVTRCYSTGLVTATAAHKGGLIGQVYTGSVNNSYYDETTGQSDTGNGDKKTTTQMKDAATFTGWDFGTVWALDTLNGGYPYLRNNLP